MMFENLNGDACLDNPMTVAAGSKAMYEHFTLGAILGLLGVTSIKVSADPDQPGTVNVAIGSKGWRGFLFRGLVKKAVQKKLDDPAVRPLTDLVIVRSLKS
jgi:phage-related baseplate assembly protein